MSIDIRALKPGDAAMVAALHARAGAGRPWSATEYGAILARTDVQGALAVATPDGAPCGFALWSVAAGEAELYEIAVDLGWRRQGVGRRLMAALEESLRHQGVSALYLEVAEDNESARRFYRSLGFEPAGRRAGYYTSGPAPVDAVVMRKALLG